MQVREPHEYEAGSIPSALLIPLGELPEALGMDDSDFEQTYGAAKPGKGHPNLVVYCRCD